LEQRRDALERGIRLIEWTFDPLEWKNARFNLNRLGAIARRYIPNQYGISSSPLHRGLPTDRLVAEWWLDSPRVAALAHDRTAAPHAVQQKIDLPLEVLEENEQMGLTISDVQARLRDQFQQAFASGFATVGFEVEDKMGRYLLGPGGQSI
jgi:predicted GNAT superfamily acetyltransferase